MTSQFNKKALKIAASSLRVTEVSNHVVDLLQRILGNTAHGDFSVYPVQRKEGGTVKVCKAPETKDTPTTR